MLLVHAKTDAPGVLEVAWEWLPAFMARNQGMIRELDSLLTERFAGGQLNESLLNVVHREVVDFLCGKYRINGLAGYLDSLRDVGTK